jgi:hypothetical protein
MTPQRPENVSVIEPLGAAFDRVKTILFSPFDLGKWFTIGFCAWLAYLGTNGHGGGGGGGGRGDVSYNVSEDVAQAKEYVLANLNWIIPLALIVVLLIIVLWFLFTWLSSRGQFMFLHCVARNEAQVSAPWTKFRRHGNSLFLFRIVLGLIGFVVIGIPVLLVAGLIIMMMASEGAVAVGALGLVITGFIIFLAAIIFALIGKFTKDFVVPIMFLRTASCTAGWREFLTILSVNKARFALYILVQILIAMVIGAIVWMGFCIGCCLCCISVLLLIPYIGTVILLPIHIFTRSYSLLYLRQFGPQFDVFGPETENLPST